MDKKLILNKIIDKLNENMKSVQSNYNTYKKFSSEAPGAMESHSDTSRFQYGALASDTASHLEEIKKAIKNINDSQDISYDQVTVGALLKMEEDGKIFYFLMVQEGAGGQKLEYDGVMIQTVPDNSPIGGSLLSKKDGDEVQINIAGKNRKMKILEVK